MLFDFGLPMALANFLGMQIDVRTNAFWAEDHDKTLSVLRGLQLQGLARLGLSYDDYHSKTISSTNIINTLEATRELKAPVYLDWIGLETRKQVLECLHMNECELRYVGPPLKVGKASRLGHEHFSYVCTKDLCSVCRSETLLTIFPGGHASLHPCCWVNPALIRKIGGSGWIRELEHEIANSPMTNFLSKFGVRGLINRARQECPGLVKPYYSRHCEACYDLLGVLFPDEAQGLPWYLEELLPSMQRVGVFG